VAHRSGASLAQLEVGHAGWERKNRLQQRKEKEGTTRRRKERLNIASFKIIHCVLGALLVQIQQNSVTLQD
jgi:hypothetical protein